MTRDLTDPRRALTSRARRKRRPVHLIGALILAVAAFGCAAEGADASAADTSDSADTAEQTEANDADANRSEEDGDHGGHVEISVEPLTSTSTFTDGVSAELQIDFGDYGAESRELADVSNIVTARITVPPGAVFPWHTHPGPVLITIAEGDFVYRLAEDCEDRHYVAGEALVDPGDGIVHTAYNPSDAPTVVIATFLGVPDGADLTIPVDGPDPDDCALPTP